MNEGNIDNKEICGYCGSAESKVLYPTDDIYGHHFFIHRCEICHAYFLAPRPNHEMLAQAYDTSYYGEQKEKFSNPWIEKVLDYFRSGRARRLTKMVPDKARILDIGCGNGRFLKYLLNFGDYEIYGTELDGNSAKRASTVPGIHLFVGSVESTDFPTGHFHAVTLFHVFEHLTQPKATLDMIDHILCDQGILMMSFPNIGSWQSRHFRGKWLHLDPPRHLFFFESEEFIHLMKQRGYRLIKEKYCSPEQNPFGMIQSILNTFFRKRELLFELLKGNKKYSQEYSSFQIFLQKLFFLTTFPFFILTDCLLSLLKQGATVEFTFIKEKS